MLSKKTRHSSVVVDVLQNCLDCSERWLAKSRVDITLCQHGKFPATLLLKFFVLYYKRNIKHFFRIDIQLYQHSWKLEKLEIVWKHSALRASCFHTISRFSNFHSCWYNCISTRKMFYISKWPWPLTYMHEYYLLIMWVIKYNIETWAIALFTRLKHSVVSKTSPLGVVCRVKNVAHLSRDDRDVW